MSAVSKYYTELAAKPRTKRTVNLKSAARINWPVFIFAVIFVSLAIVLVFYLCDCAKLVSLQYNICNLTRDKEELAKQVDMLELKVQSLQSFERIQHEAEKRLGMVKPSQSIVLNMASVPIVSQAGSYVALGKSNKPKQ